MTLSSVDDQGLLASLQVDEGLQKLGVALSEKKMYQKYSRQRPSDDSDVLKPPVPPAPGGQDAPGQPAGSAQPQRGHLVRFADWDESKHPREGDGRFAPKPTAGQGKTGKHSPLGENSPPLHPTDSVAGYRAIWDPLKHPRGQPKNRGEFVVVSSRVQDPERQNPPPATEDSEPQNVPPPAAPAGQERPYFWHKTGPNRFEIHDPESNRSWPVVVPKGETIDHFMKRMYPQYGEGAKIANPGAEIGAARAAVERPLQEQKKLDQHEAITGVPPDPTCKAHCGPDVTEWFAKDLALQVANWANEPRTLLGFKDLAAYSLSYKWMDFGGPKDGVGANTVMLAGRCIRKNQLGNIAFALLARLRPPQLFSPEAAITSAYYEMDAVGTYLKDHPHAANYGLFAGLARADNLAAFGVGNEIGERLAKQPGIENRLSSLNPDDIKSILVNVLKDDSSLKETVNRFQGLLPRGLGSDPGLDKNNPTNHGKGHPIGVDALTFIPEYGGFNTGSCKPDPKAHPYDGPSGLEYRKILDSRYRDDMADWQQKKPGVRPPDKDTWLQKNYENYDGFGWRAPRAPSDGRR